MNKVGVPPPGRLNFHLVLYKSRMCQPVYIRSSGAYRYSVHTFTTISCCSYLLVLYLVCFRSIGGESRRRFLTATGLIPLAWKNGQDSFSLCVSIVLSTDLESERAWIGVSRPLPLQPSPPLSALHLQNREGRISVNFFTLYIMYISAPYPH